MPDWKKEIKLSDLVARKPKKKKAEEFVAEPEAAPAPEAGKQSLLKKEISFSLRRKDKAPKEPKAAKAPKEPKDAAAPKPSRAERRLARQEAREAAKAEKLAKKNAPKEPKEPKEARRARRAAPPVPAVPVMRAFNLLPQENVRGAGANRPNTAQLVLAVVALVAFAGLAAYFLMLNAGVADKRSEADSLRAAVAASPGLEPQVPPDAEANTQLQQEQEARTTALAAALGRRVAWDRLLREFSLVVPEDVSLTKLSASGGGVPDPTAPAGTPPSESIFTIEGYTQSQEAVARLLSRLSVLPELSTVDLESSVATEFGQTGTRIFQFVIRTIVKPTSGSTL